MITKHGSAEVIRTLYAHQLSIIGRKPLTTIQGKPQHNRAILPVSRLPNREHYVETIVTGMSLGWDFGTRTTQMYLLPHVPSSAGWWHVVAPSPSTGHRFVWHSCHGPGQRRAEAIVWRQSTRPSIAVWNCPVHLPTQPSLCRWRCYRPRTPWSRSSRSCLHRLAICSVWFTCLHARVRHPCPAQHHWRGRPLQRLHLQPQRRQQLGQVSEREQPLGRHWAVRTTP